MTIPNSADVLVAIDVGTSGARASAYTLDGYAVCAARRSFPTDLPREGWAEQDARRWRSASISALGELIDRLGARRIRAIGLTGQCPSMVALDRRNEPLRPGIIYRDNRAIHEAAGARDLLGARHLHERTGHVMEAFHLAAKLLWLRAHEPEVYDGADHFLEPSEYVALALTGEYVTDWTVAAASGLLDVRARSWAVDVIDALGLDSTKLASPHPSWSVVGALRPVLSRRFGLSYPVPVVIGAGDSIACAFGAGVIEPGPASEMAGSSSCFNTILREPVADLDVTHYPSGVGPSGYVTEVGINTTGEAVESFAGLFYGGRSGRARDADFDRLDQEAATAPVGANGLMFAPVLGDGERDDATLRGAAIGLSLRHDRASWARATFEGIAFGVRTRIETLDRQSTPTTELRVSGRSADLRTWNQIKADVLGIPVRRIPGEATAAGVALLAGLGCGVYADAAEAVATACRFEPALEPDPAAHVRYDELFEQYQAVVESATVHVTATAGGT